MAFTFPDPNVATEVTAPNGITYTWDAADEKWSVKSYGVDQDTFDTRFVNSTGGDEMEGPFKVDGSLEVTAGIDVSGTKITNLDSPVDATDATNKEYVDDTISDEIGKLPPGMKDGGLTGQILSKKSDADYDTEWIANTTPDLLDDLHQPGTLDERYVNAKGGDNMQGPLHITGGRSADADGIVSTLQTLNVDSGGSSSLQLKWNGGTKVYVGEEQTTLVGDLKFNTSGKSIYAQGPDKKGFTINNAGVFYEGAYTADKHIATKANVESALYTDTTDTDTNIYLKRAGDSMTGGLEMKLGSGLLFNGLQDGNVVFELGRNTAVFQPLFRLKHSGGSTAGGYDIRVEGNTNYNQLRIMGGSNAALPTATFKGNGNILFHNSIDFQDQRLKKVGTPVEVNDAATKAYVDSQTGVAVENEAIIKARKNEDSIISARDGLADLIAAEVLIATEDENYLQANLMEHCVPCWPDINHPLYHLIPQDYVLFTRMFEGAKKTEDAGGNIISNNQTLDSDYYGNDGLSNVMIFHIPTGKIKDISIVVSHEGDSWSADGTTLEPNKKPALRGHTVIPRDNGDVDIYSWIHNPRRNPKSQPGAGQPLVRTHIPANANPSDPFANVTITHTNIYCDPALLTTPTENPYDIYQANTSKSLQYQYEISPVAWNLVDSMTGERHYFMMSYNKGSRDYVTQRVFEINFDESDPDEGTITPVGASAQSTKHGSYCSGWNVIKKDVNGVFRCFLYGSPCGLTELYFTGDYYNRVPETRNYDQYIPLGNRIEEPNGIVNGIGQPVIVGKGIVDNWYKSTTLVPQFMTQAPIDNDDYFSNIIIWFQSAYGVCSLNIQDLGTVDRSDETHLINNYQGSELELSSMMIETKNFYMSYLQDSSSRNLMRFNVKQPDTHSHGSIYFFDYKSDYKYDTIAGSGGTPAGITNQGEFNTLYNSTRKYDVNGNLTQVHLFKRPILEARPNYQTGLIEIHAVIVGVQHWPSGEEIGYHESFSGESVTKFGDVFVCSGAAKSHSSVREPRIYIFDPQSRQIQRCSNTEVNSTSIIPCPDHGLVVGSSYGSDVSDNPTPIHMTSMISIQKVAENRNNARTLRKLYAVTGDSVANDPNTWTLDPPQSSPASVPSSVFTDSNETVWDVED